MFMAKQGELWLTISALFLIFQLSKMGVFFLYVVVYYMPF